MSGLTHNEERQSLIPLLCVGPFYRFVLVARVSTLPEKLMRKGHFGVPASLRTAGTKIIYYDINFVLLLLSLLAIIYFIITSRKIKEVH